jgi:hypothetical protein
MSKTSI